MQDGFMQETKNSCIDIKKNHTFKYNQALNCEI